jgi:hypothetical protein
MTIYHDFLADVRFRGGLVDTEVVRTTITVLSHRVLADDRTPLAGSTPETGPTLPALAPDVEVAQLAIEVALEEKPDQEGYLTEAVLALLNESEALLLDDEVLDLLRRLPYWAWDHRGIPQTVQLHSASGDFRMRHPRLG